MHLVRLRTVNSSATAPTEITHPTKSHSKSTVIKNIIPKQRQRLEMNQGWKTPWICVSSPATGKLIRCQAGGGRRACHKPFDRSAESLGTFGKQASGETRSPGDVLGLTRGDGRLEHGGPAPKGLAQEMMAKKDMAGCKMQTDKAMGMMKQSEERSRSATK